MFTVSCGKRKLVLAGRLSLTVSVPSVSVSFRDGVCSAPPVYFNGVDADNSTFYSILEYSFPYLWDSVRIDCIGDTSVQLTGSQFAVWYRHEAAWHQCQDPSFHTALSHYHGKITLTSFAPKINFIFPVCSWSSRWMPSSQDSVCIPDFARLSLVGVITVTTLGGLWRPT